MTNSIQRINRMFLLACAPFLGMLIWMMAATIQVELPSLVTEKPEPFALHEQASTVAGKLSDAGTNASQIKSTIQKYYQMYDKSNSDVAALLKQTSAQVTKPNAIFDSRIAAAFGRPTRTASSGNIDLKLYTFQEKSYRGYALKAELKTDKAMKMVLGSDRIGGSETTLSAAKRYGAIAGINAGGFADDRTGRYPTDNTIYNGKFVYGFFPANNGYSFVGLSTDRKLIGGSFARQRDLDALKPSFGASFQPILLQGGNKSPIPDKWYTPYRAPRTVIGNFKNDQLLVIVTDGYDERGGSGATLAELQDKMLALGVRDAYNLDGGGSSTLVFDGAVINSPSDGKMRLLPTHFLFFK